MKRRPALYSDLDAMACEDAAILEVDQGHANLVAEVDRRVSQFLHEALLA